MLMLALIISSSAIVYAENDEITVTVEKPAGVNLLAYEAVYRYSSADNRWEYLAGIIFKSWINVKFMYFGYANELILISEQLVKLNQEQGLQFLNEVNADEHTPLGGSQEVTVMGNGISQLSVGNVDPAVVVVPGSTATSASSSLSLPSSDFCQSSLCNEIDNVWSQIRGYFTEELKNKIYDPGAGWILPPISVVTLGAQPTIPTELKARIIELAKKELENWGNKVETDSEQLVKLKEYHTAGRCTSKEVLETPWSAAFISYVMKEAIASFIGECEHVKYFDNINKNPGICKTNDINNIKQLRPGDILCACRNANGQNGCKIEYNGEYSSQPAHCDIVVSENNDKFQLIGGNLGDTVKMREVNANELKNPPYFGFISCG